MFLKRVLVRLKSGVQHIVPVIFRKNGFQPGTLPEKDYKKDNVNGEEIKKIQFVSYYKLKIERHVTDTHQYVQR